MNNKINFDDILIEWGYRVHNGQPNPKDTTHLYHLSQILYENGWPYQVVEGLIQNLLEQETQFKGRTKDGQLRYYKTKDALDKALEKGTVEPVEVPDKKKDEPKGDKVDKPSDFERGTDQNKGVSADFTRGDVQNKNEVSSGADSKIKNLALQYGYKVVEDDDGNVVFKPAPGNAGSMLNEIISGEVTDIITKNPDLTDEQIIEQLEDRFGESELFRQNLGSKPAGDLKTGDVPEGKNRGLYSKLLIATRSGRRKHKKAMRKAEENNFKNPEVSNYYGHSDSFDAMVQDIQGKEVIGPDGTPINQTEAEDLIRSGGGGDNPSDTATLVFDEDSNRVIMLFHSDKDSTSAIVAQSSAKAEAEANEKQIDELVKEGTITEEQAEAIKGQNKELVEDLNDIEKELKPLMVAPAKHFKDNVSTKEALNSVLTDTDPDGNKDGNKTSTKFKDLKGKKGNVKPPVDKYLPDGVENPTDEQLLEAFLDFMGDPDKEKEPTQSNLDLMERLNRRFVDKGAPDVDGQLEEIRNRTIERQERFMDEMDDIKMDVDGKEVGIGTFLEGNTAWKQFHLEATNSESDKGVHKYPGMFETNHAGNSVDGETLQGCFKGKVKNKNDFIKRLEVGETTAQKGRTGTQKGRTTGSKRIVYAITAEGEKIEVGVKVARTKTGKLGKLQTVYEWSDDMKKCFSETGKRD